MSNNSTSQQEDPNHPSQDRTSRRDLDTKLENTNGLNCIHGSPRDFETYYRVFCLSEVHDQYFNEFSKYAFEEDIPWQKIVTLEAARIFAELRGTSENLDEESFPPLTFLSSTVADIYAFFDAYLRPTDNTHHISFTSFTFIVVDAACLRASPPECVLCHNTPDYDEPVDGLALLKRLYMPLAMAKF